MSLRRLLLVSEPGRDGVFDHVAGLADHLRRSHPEVVIDLAFSSHRAGPQLQKLVDDIRHHGGEAVDLGIGHAPQPADFGACGKILRLVRQHRPQIVHAHSSKAGALCRILGAVWPGFPPVIYTPNAYFGLGRQRSAKTFFFNTLEMLFGRIGHTINASFDERLFSLRQLHLPARRLVLINNGIDLERFHPVDAELKRKCRIALGFPETGPLLITVGRDSFQKNYGPLYQALDLIFSDPAGDVIFAHAGAGSVALGQTLSPASQNRFRAFAHLDPIEKLLFAADAFVLTSRYEGLSLSALQALGCGLKVFLSRVPGNTSMEKIGFREISWINHHEATTEMADEIERVLCEWLRTPVPPGPGQIQRAQKSIAAGIQFEKVYRLYRHLIEQHS